MISIGTHSIPATGLRAGRRLALVGASLLAVAPDALALLDDSLQVFVGETVTSDSNVFRISGALNPQVAIGSPEIGDTFSTTTLGVNVDKRFSRQRLLAGASWNKVRYQRFSDLDYLGRDGRIAWLWELGECLNGQVGYNETKTLASFSNIQGRTANSLQTRRTYGTIGCRLTLNWTVQTGLAETEQRNSNPARAENDVDLRSADLSVLYTTRAQNRLGAVVRRDDGSYLNPQLVAGIAVDNGYRQNGAGLVAEWALTAKSKLDARVERLRRDYDQLPQRNFDGVVFNATYTWLFSEKLNFAAMAQRDISPAEDIQTSFVLIEGVTARTSYDFSDKVNLSASGGFGTRDYLGDPGLALGTAGERSDRTRFLGGAIAYRPMRALTLRIAAQRETRTSNVRFNDYTADIASVSARLTF